MFISDQKNIKKFFHNAMYDKNKHRQIIIIIDVPLPNKKKHKKTNNQLNYSGMHWVEKSRQSIMN